MHIHLIAIGGSIMHNLAIALKKKGYHITGSDDEIYEPACSRLAAHGLLPESQGWNPETITTGIDTVILGMHAKADNPELLHAKELGIPVQSFPEYIFGESKDKLRVAICGSHGKTTVTSMIMHVLREAEKNFDYAVGSQVAGFEDSVRLSADAPVIIIEGDEYLTSPIDRKPKFLWYHPQIAVLTGIAWDHVNVFPTYEEYTWQFELLLEDMKPDATLIYNADDEEVVKVVEKSGQHLRCLPALPPATLQEEGKMVVNFEGKLYSLQFFGRHNLQNMAAAQLVCGVLGVDGNTFYRSIGSFTGAGKRLEKVFDQDNLIVYRDFAHAPSKVAASVHAVREQHPKQNLVAVVELNTFSSLQENFISGYRGTLSLADQACVLVEEEVVKRKGNIIFSEETIQEAFDRQDIRVCTTREELQEYLLPELKAGNVLLLMSSGSLAGLDLKSLRENRAG